jgi:hypothetical protein
MFGSHSGPGTVRQNECGCHCSSPHFRRRFISPNEEKMILENYFMPVAKEVYI